MGVSSWRPPGKGLHQIRENTPLANYDELKKTFIGVTKLPENVVDKQLKERTELTHSRIGAPQRESILAAGVALQQAGVIDAKVDVKAALDSLIDDQVPLPTN